MTIRRAMNKRTTGRYCSSGIQASRAPLCLIFAALLATLTSCAPKPPKIVFVPGERSHGYGMHEHNAGLLLIARSLKQQWPELETVVTEKDAWPASGILADADAIVMACEGSKHVALPHIDEVDALAKRGIGIVLIHYAIEPPEGPGAEAVWRWIGGNHERGWSINPDWAAKFTDFPDHPAARGLAPFTIYDEWYFHMRFVPDRKGITPILETRPQLSTLLRNDGPSSNNPAVRDSVLRGDRHAVAWAYERPGGGRGFGFTGAHHHRHYRDNNFRKAVLNGVAWAAGLEVPIGGVESAKPTWEEIAANQDYEKPEKWEEEAGLKMSGSADPVYSTPPISSGAEPFDLEVEIPPARYRHIYFVFESDSPPPASYPGNSQAAGEIRLENPRFRGEPGNEAPLHEEVPGHFIGPAGTQEPPADWSEPDRVMAIPAPSLLYYPVPRGSTHFLARVSFQGEAPPDRKTKPRGRVRIFFAPPAESHFLAP